MSLEKKTETLTFQAEIKQLLNIVINSLYSNKEIFLRELISNASDAADRLRFESINSNIINDNHEYKIYVDIDKVNKTISISDNGIGMSKNEIIENLGTIAKSGSKDFLKNLTSEQTKDSKFIGQFGVGFYSSFIVAEKVTVHSRRVGLSKEEAVFWTSNGKGEYEIEYLEKDNCGTKVTLFIKPEEHEFLEAWKIRSLIIKYSDHITLPILMKKEKSIKSNEQETTDITEYEIINKAVALWILNKSEITDTQYKDLYKHISYDSQDPLMWVHNKIEGNIEFISLLYIPSHAPFDLLTTNKPKGLKLYVQRVFILDAVEQFLPHYLRFVRGIIDANDLPLNISREILQNSKIIDNIKNSLTKRILGMLSKLAKNNNELYLSFWKEFGKILKEGIAEDFNNKMIISKLLRFSSTRHNNIVADVSLDDYINNMSEKQDKIYYIAAENFNLAKNSPHLEIFKKKNIEVLLLIDRVDEWLMSHLTEFSDKKIQSILKGSLELGKLNDEIDIDKKSKITEEYKTLINKVKEALKDDVKDVRITTRLTDSPSCIVVDEFDMTPQMERIMKAAGQNITQSKSILELNPDHPLIKLLNIENSKEKFYDWAKILLDQAILAEGGQLKDPINFVKRFNTLLLKLDN
ncbi:MAG: molecular chaperone HtpG [Candidatus Azosocius agrarius]|nr:MAG: molecular chaperone HtpG [Gammaproteobacteria bacterium]